MQHACRTQPVTMTHCIWLCNWKIALYIPASKYCTLVRLNSGPVFFWLCYYNIALHRHYIKCITTDTLQKNTKQKSNNDTTCKNNNMCKNNNTYAKTRQNKHKKHKWCSANNQLKSGDLNFVTWCSWKWLFQGRRWCACWTFKMNQMKYLKYNNINCNKAHAQYYKFCLPMNGMQCDITLCRTGDHLAKIRPPTGPQYGHPPDHRTKVQPPTGPTFGHPQDHRTKVRQPTGPKSGNPPDHWTTGPKSGLPPDHWN